MIQSNSMNQDVLNNFDVLKEEESLIYNGGSVAVSTVKSLFPPIVYPIPDPEQQGRL